MPEKHYLVTPGPTPVPPEVLEVLARPAIHPRGPAFKHPYERVLGRLKEVFRTEHWRGRDINHLGSEPGCRRSTTS